MKAKAKLITTCLLTFTLLVLMSLIAYAEPLSIVFLDTREIPADGAAGPVYITEPLLDGAPYLITVEGTFSVWQPSSWNTVCAGTPENSPMYPSPSTINGMVGHDAAYVFAYVAGSPYFCPYPDYIPQFDLPVRHTNFQYSIDNGNSWTRLFPVDVSYNPEHVYQYEIIGAGDQALLGFRFRDHNSTENYGQLKIQVEMVNTNSPPLSDPNGPYLGAANSPILLDGTNSTDPDGDTLTHVWDFGDGSIGTGEQPSHSYITAGIYDVCLKVNDGQVDSETICTFAVIYDPDGGFVTGGGWFNSPEGAYLPDLGLSGKASFGFVSRYKKGASVPTGNTSFQFQTADISFHSSEYEWLVVNQNGTNAQFKGSGTINGVGDYQFMLWAGDGNPDTFRIRIWEEANSGEVVIYDNGIAQSISGGNIVVHTSKK